MTLESEEPIKKRDLPVMIAQKSEVSSLGITLIYIAFMFYEIKTQKERTSGTKEKALL